MYIQTTLNVNEKHFVLRDLYDGWEYIDRNIQDLSPIGILCLNENNRREGAKERRKGRREEDG